MLEDTQGVCGYVLAALDSRLFYTRFKTDWLQTVLDKYPVPAPDTAQSNVLPGPEEVCS